jgi:hypothetical protein
MRADCHVHTQRHSACSRLDPHQACRQAVRRGIDLMVFTEHHYMWSQEELAGLRLAHPELVLLSGVELTVAEMHDVVVIAPCGVVHGLRAWMPAADLGRALEEVGPDAFSFVAHPFRYTDRLGPELSSVLDVVDGVEMNSWNLLKNGYDLDNGLYRPHNHRLYDRVRRDWPHLVGVFNTDAHHKDILGTVGMDLDGGRVRDEADLARVLKAGLVREFQEPRLLDKLLSQAGS